MPKIFTTARVEDAVNRFNAGYTCSEAVLTAFGPALGLDEAMAMKVASGFAGGLGLETEDVCGVVTAAISVLGLRYGPGSLSQEGQENPRDSLRRIRAEYLDRFIQRHGSVSCKELRQGMEIGTPEKGQALLETGIPENLVRSASELLCNLVRDEAS